MGLHRALKEAIRPAVVRSRRLRRSVVLAGQRLPRRAWQSPGARAVRRALGAYPFYRILRDRFVTAGPHRIVTVRVDRLLMGGEQGYDGTTWSELTENPARCSTGVVDSPHVNLLQQHAVEGQGVLQADLFPRTRYARNAAEVIQHTGSYFGARNTSEVSDRARSFVDWSPTKERDLHPAETSPGQLIRVRPIRYSDCYQVIDGMHRLAHQIALGAADIEVAVATRSTTTPVQNILLAMSWLQGRRELYQPVPFPEVQTWPLVRHCTDRLEMMQAVIPERTRGGSYLDVGCSYGWFVSEMAKRGFTTGGVELDPRAPRLGQLAYGLECSRVQVGEAVEFLRGRALDFDVVSCFSLLHHFVMGRGPCGAEEFIRLLDETSRHILFLDTGESHETWLADQLPDWNARFVEAWLRKHTKFSEIRALGRDKDSSGRYRGNYGRMLFACIR